MQPPNVLCLWRPLSAVYAPSIRRRSLQNDYCYVESIVLFIQLVHCAFMGTEIAQ